MDRPDRYEPSRRSIATSSSGKPYQRLDRSPTPLASSNVAYPLNAQSHVRLMKSGRWAGGHIRLSKTGPVEPFAGFAGVGLGPGFPRRENVRALVAQPTDPASLSERPLDARYPRYSYGSVRGAVSDDRPYRDPEIIQGVDGAIAHAVGMNHQDFGGFWGASVTADASAAFCSRVRREMNMTAMVSDMRR